MSTLWAMSRLLKVSSRSTCSVSWHSTIATYARWRCPPPGQLVKEQSLERTRIEEADVLGDYLLVVFGEAAPGVGEPPETDELANSEPGTEVILLEKDGDHLG